MKNKMNKLREMITMICVFYMVISMINAIAAIGDGEGVVSSYNQVRILIWSSIGATVIYSHKLFERFSPLGMILLQYLFAMCLIYLEIWFETAIIGFELHPDGIRDAFRSFTIPYIIGAIFYYLHLYLEVSKQDKLLKRVKNIAKT